MISKTVLEWFSSPRRAHRGISITGLVVLLAVLAAAVLCYRAVYPAESAAFSACQRYADGQLFFRHDAALKVSTGVAAKAVREAKANRLLEEMTREIAGFCWGTWRTVKSEQESGDRVEITFFQSVDRMPEHGGPTRQITTRIRAKLVRAGAAWKVSEWTEEEWKGGLPFAHRIRQLTAYRKGEPPGLS